jgi:5-oxoprolinase (ATP-hydrolysing)
MTACILSERRAVRPFGILGGGSAQAGLNLLLTADGRTVNLGGKNNVQLRAGERLRILTPGAQYGCPQPCPAEDFLSCKPSSLVQDG